MWYVSECGVLSNVSQALWLGFSQKKMVWKFVNGKFRDSFFLYQKHHECIRNFFVDSTATFIHCLRCHNCNQSGIVLLKLKKRSNIFFPKRGCYKFNWFSLNKRDMFVHIISSVCFAFKRNISIWLSLLHVHFFSYHFTFRLQRNNCDRLCI